MTLLKLASPGVPDLYQGDEMLAFQLVDPDNRLHVDYEVRRTQLARLEALSRDAAPALAAAIPTWFADSDGALAKLWITCRLLRYRAVHRATMTHGVYLPVSAAGPRADHVVAFARRHGDACAIAVAGRLFASFGLAPGVLPLGRTAWGDTVLDVGFLPPDTRVVNVLSREAIAVRDGRIALAEVFGTFPGALLHCVPAER